VNANQGCDSGPGVVRRLIVLALACGSAAALAGCGEPWRDKYTRIENGMTETQVEALLGGKGEEGREIGVRRPYRINAEKKKVDVESGLVWQTWRRGNEAIAVGFKDGKVAEKAREWGPP
jgi:hypothetical protein